MIWGWIWDHLSLFEGISEGHLEYDNFRLYGKKIDVNKKYVDFYAE